MPEHRRLVDAVRPSMSNGVMYALVHRIPEPYRARFMNDIPDDLFTTSKRGKLMVPFIVWTRWLTKNGAFLKLQNTKEIA
jgi:hypothetical protein